MLAYKVPVNTTFAVNVIQPGNLQMIQAMNAWLAEKYYLGYPANTLILPVSNH